MPKGLSGRFRFLAVTNKAAMTHCVCRILVERFHCTPFAARPTGLSSMGKHRPPPQAVSTGCLLSMYSTTCGRVFYLIGYCSKHFLSHIYSASCTHLPHTLCKNYFELNHRSKIKAKTLSKHKKNLNKLGLSKHFLGHKTHET